MFENRFRGMERTLQEEMYAIIGEANNRAKEIICNMLVEERDYRVSNTEFQAFQTRFKKALDKSVKDQCKLAVKEVVEDESFLTSIIERINNKQIKGR